MTVRCSEPATAGCFGFGLRDTVSEKGAADIWRGAVRVRWHSFRSGGMEDAGSSDGRPKA
jgi:hypothetical protein